MTRFTREQITRADRTLLVPYLKARGFALEHDGGNRYRVAGYDGLLVRENQWYSKAERRGGKALDFVMEFERKSFPEAVKALIGEEGKEEARPRVEAPKEHPDPAELKLPEPAENNSAAYAYLRERGIDAGLILECMEQGRLYQSDMYWQEDGAGGYERKECPPQAVFVGTDPSGTPRCAAVRSCAGPDKYNAYGSDRAYGFALPEDGSRTLWVFEGAVDLLSHATLSRYAGDRYPAHRISLGGTDPAAMLQYFSDHPDIRYVDLALDADAPGREAAEKIKEMLKDKVRVYDHPPASGKDYNEDLLARQERYREQKRQTPQEER